MPRAGTVAKVNGVAIPQSRLDLVVKAATAQGQPDSAEVRNALRENLITEEILAQEAIKKGLDRSPEVVTQIDLARQGILIRAYQADFMRNNPVSDSELRKEYESVKAQMGDKEYKARHILVETEQEAKDLVAALKKAVRSINWRANVPLTLAARVMVANWAGVQRLCTSNHLLMR